MDESALSSSIFESLRKCVELREKYTAIGLQRKQDNPRDYPDLSFATTKNQVSPIKVHHTPSHFFLFILLTVV